ncbi:MAG TPA: hypothetical protein VGR78_12855, partial [Verrucomicrobiae bacterium]|nr:hypothetical protein [Verrucomicrobiae bacterium]
MVNVGHGQEFRSCREAAAVDQHKNGLGEERLAGLLKIQLGILDLMVLAVGAELGQSLRNNQSTVVARVFVESVPCLAILVDDEVFVILEGRFRELGK